VDTDANYRRNRAVACAEGASPPGFTPRAVRLQDESLDRIREARLGHHNCKAHLTIP